MYLCIEFYFGEYLLVNTSVGHTEVFAGEQRLTQLLQTPGLHICLAKPTTLTGRTHRDLVSWRFFLCHLPSFFRLFYMEIFLVCWLLLVLHAYSLQ